MPRLFETPALSVIDVPADAAHDGGLRKRSPEVIVIHATAGVDSLKWLSTTSSPLVSIHRLIHKDGRIFKILPDDHIGFHVGRSQIGTRAVPVPDRSKGQVNPNEITLGIELENRNTGKDPYPDVQISSCAMQVLEWWSLYGFLPVVGHFQVDTQGKTDPKGFSWATFHERCRSYLQQSLGGGVLAADVRKYLTEARVNIDAALLGLLG